MGNSPAGDTGRLNFRCGADAAANAIPSRIPVAGGAQ